MSYGNYENLVLMHTLLLKISPATKTEQKNPQQPPPQQKPRKKYKSHQCSLYPSNSFCPRLARLGGGAGDRKKE